MYDVLLGDRSVSRHIDQLLPRVTESSVPGDDSYLYFKAEEEPEPEEEAERPSIGSAEPTLSEPRYPARQRRLPIRYPDEDPSVRHLT